MHEATPHDEAMQRGAAALAKDKKGMFKFNPGKQQKTFPDYNPYTISKCNTCTRKLELADTIQPNQLCQACVIIRSMVQKEAATALTNEDRNAIRMAANEWANRHLPEITLPNGQKAKRLVIDNDGNQLIVSKRFFSETFAKNVRHGRLAETMDLSTKVGVWLPSATLTGVEEGRHHACNFLVYEATYNGISIQCKVKDQAEKMVYTMKII